MTRLLVEIDDFVAAARTLDEGVGDPVNTALARLTSALDACGGMAGDDPVGRDWAGSYEVAAQSVGRATAQLAAAAYSTSAMFGHSALNYARAEAASTTGRSDGSAAGLSARLPGRPVLVPAQPPPRAVGSGSSGQPSGWGLISDLVGHAWPNGHQDRLRAAAAAYRRCADALDGTGIQPSVAGIVFARDRLPEADDVLTVCQGLTERIRQLTSAHRTVARACDEFAHTLDDCHSEVESELSELGIESGVIQGIGAGLSVFTFGGAELPTQGVQAVRVAAVAAKVGELISAFGTTVRTLASAIPEAAAVGDRITQTLEGLAGARLAYAGVTNVPRLTQAGRMAMEGREAAAAGNLAREASSSYPARLIGRKYGEGGIWKTPRSLRRHFRDHGREVGAATPEEYAQRATDLLQRALHDKLPTRIDPKNGTIRVYDPSTGEFGSFRPDGAAFTYFKPNRGAEYFAEQPGGS